MFPVRRSIGAVIATAVVSIATYAVVLAPVAQAAGPLISQGKPATASSVENGGSPAANAFDGNTGTRWSSAFSDPQWVQVDLGATAAIDQVILIWEAAYATAFQIQTSPNGTAPWTTIYSTTTGTGGTQTLAITGNGRYVRMNGTARSTGWGYSLWEFQVFGTIGGGPSPTPSPTSGPGPGNVISEFKQVAASSWEGGNAPAAALDGRLNTRWSSLFSDPQWLRIDFGGTATISRVVLNWEGAFARGYRLETSNDANTWTTIYSTTTGPGGVETLNVSGTGRYLRFYGTARATGYGYSLWELQVHGSVDTAASTPPMLSGPTRPPGTHRPVRPERTRRRGDGHHHAAAGPFLGNGFGRGALPGLDQHQPHRLRLHPVRQPHRLLHQGRRADWHELHAQLGSARSMDLQVVHHLGQRIGRHHHFEHPQVQRLRAHH